jgi:hypothetical protein
MILADRDGYSEGTHPSLLRFTINIILKILIKPREDILKTRAVDPSITQMTIYKISSRHDHKFHFHRREELKSQNNVTHFLIFLYFYLFHKFSFSINIERSFKFLFSFIFTHLQIPSNRLVDD